MLFRSHALGAAAYNNQPLWGPGGWDISLIVDGNRNQVIHGGEGNTDGFAYSINMGTEVKIEEIDIWPRQDGCCPDRLSNYRVSVHNDNNGQLGDEVWGADLHTDGSNSGSGRGVKETITGDQNPTGSFKGQWIRIMALDTPPKIGRAHV